MLFLWISSAVCANAEQTPHTLPPTSAIPVSSNCWLFAEFGLFWHLILTPLVVHFISHLDYLCHWLPGLPVSI